MLLTLFPEFEWQMWLFHYAPRYFWKDMKNQRKSADWAAAQLRVQDYADWYPVTQAVLNKLIGTLLSALRPCNQ
jgi:hypothetical protein